MVLLEVWWRRCIIALSTLAGANAKPFVVTSSTSRHAAIASKVAVVRDPSQLGPQLSQLYSRTEMETALERTQAEIADGLSQIRQLAHSPAPRQPAQTSDARPALEAQSANFETALQRAQADITEGLAKLRQAKGVPEAALASATSRQSYAPSGRGFPPEDSRTPASPPGTSGAESPGRFSEEMKQAQIEIAEALAQIRKVAPSRSQTAPVSAAPSVSSSATSFCKSYTSWSNAAPAARKTEPLYAPAAPSKSLSIPVATAPMSEAPSASSMPASLGKSYFPLSNEAPAALKSESLYAPAALLKSQSPPVVEASLSAPPSASSAPASSGKSYSPWGNEAPSARKNEPLYAQAAPSKSQPAPVAPAPVSPAPPAAKAVPALSGNSHSPWSSASTRSGVASPELQRAQAELNDAEIAVSDAAAAAHTPSFWPPVKLSAETSLAPRPTPTYLSVEVPPATTSHASDSPSKSFSSWHNEAPVARKDEPFFVSSAQSNSQPAPVVVAPVPEAPSASSSPASSGNSHSPRRNEAPSAPKIEPLYVPTVPSKSLPSPADVVISLGAPLASSSPVSSGKSSFPWGNEAPMARKSESLYAPAAPSKSQPAPADKVISPAASSAPSFSASSGKLYSPWSNKAPSARKIEPLYAAAAPPKLQAAPADAFILSAAPSASPVPASSGKSGKSYSPWGNGAPMARKSESLYAPAAPSKTQPAPVDKLISPAASSAPSSPASSGKLYSPWSDEAPSARKSEPLYAPAAPSKSQPAPVAPAPVSEPPSALSAPASSGKSYSPWSKEAPSARKSEPLYAPAAPSNLLPAPADTVILTAAQLASSSSTSSGRSYSPWTNEAPIARKSEPLYAPGAPLKSQPAPVAAAPSASSAPASSGKSYSPWGNEAPSARKSEPLYAQAAPSKSQPALADAYILSAAPPAPSAPASSGKSYSPWGNEAPSSRKISPHVAPAASPSRSPVLPALDIPASSESVVPSPSGKSYCRLGEMKRRLLGKVSLKRRRTRGLRWWSFYTIAILSVYEFVVILALRLAL